MHMASIGIDLCKAHFSPGFIRRAEQGCGSQEVLTCTAANVCPLVSTATVAAIGNGAAFRRGHDFAAWVGVVPRQYSTGGKQRLFAISKRGNSAPSKLRLGGNFDVHTSQTYPISHYRVIPTGVGAPATAECPELRLTRHEPCATLLAGVSCHAPLCCAVLHLHL